MIRVRRPSEKNVLQSTTRSALAKRRKSAQKLNAGDKKIQVYWSNFLKSKPRVEVSEALDQLFCFKCAYCECVAAQDIEHFYPKSMFPKQMFSWQNFFRGCKNCNNFKRDEFPLMANGKPILLDPCIEEPLDYFVWDFETGMIGFQEIRGETTANLLRLNLEPLREERRLKLRIVLFLLARVCNEQPVSQETSDRLREELDQRRPWLGIIRQLFKKPGGKYDGLLKLAQQRLPEINKWISLWC